MIFKVTNKGESRILNRPTGAIFLETDESVELNNISGLSGVEGLEIKELSSPEPLKVDLPGELFVDYSAMKVKELRSVASKLGINGCSKMRKAELIEVFQQKEKSQHV